MQNYCITFVYIDVLRRCRNAVFGDTGANKKKAENVAASCAALPLPLHIQQQVSLKTESTIMWIRHRGACTRVVHDIETGQGLAKKEEKHELQEILFKTSSWQLPSLSLPVASLEKHYAQLKALSFDVYYARYKAYAPDQDRFLRFMQYSAWFAAKALPSNTIIAGFLSHLYDRISFGRGLLRFYCLPDSIKATRTGSWGGSSGMSKILGHFSYGCMHGGILPI